MNYQEEYNKLLVENGKLREEITRLKRGNLTQFDEHESNKYSNTPKSEDNKEYEKPAQLLDHYKEPLLKLSIKPTNKWTGMESDSEDEDDETIYQTWLEKSKTYVKVCKK